MKEDILIGLQSYYFLLLPLLNLSSSDCDLESMNGNRNKYEFLILHATGCTIITYFSPFPLCFVVTDENLT